MDPQRGKASPSVQVRRAGVMVDIEEWLTWRRFVIAVDGSIEEH